MLLFDRVTRGVTSPLTATGLPRFLSETNKKLKIYFNKVTVLENKV